MTFTVATNINDEVTSITLISTVLADLAGAVHTGVDVTAVDHLGTTTTVAITAGDLTGNDYIVLPTFFTAGATTIANSFYVFTVTSTAPSTTASDSGCVIADPTLQCNVFNKVKEDTNVDFHIIYQVLQDTNGCTSCSCATSQELYKKLIVDLNSTNTNAADCGCS